MNIRKHSFRFIKPQSTIFQGVFFAFSLFISSYCYAGIYKWVDAQGNVHYDQQRPTDTPSESMNIQHHAPGDNSSYKHPGAKEAPKEGEENKAKKTADTADEKKPETAAEKKRRMAACVQAKNNLKTMESVGRIKSRDKTGNTSFLSQEQKEAQMKQTRELISKHCK